MIYTNLKREAQNNPKPLGTFPEGEKWSRVYGLQLPKLKWGDTVDQDDRASKPSLTMENAVSPSFLQILLLLRALLPSLNRLFRSCNLCCSRRARANSSSPTSSAAQNGAHRTKVAHHITRKKHMQLQIKVQNQCQDHKLKEHQPS